MPSWAAEAKKQAARRPRPPLPRGCVRLASLKLVKRGAHILKRLGHHVANAKVQQVVIKQAADEKLKREIVDALLALLLNLALVVAGDAASTRGDELGECIEAVMRATELKIFSRVRTDHRAVLVDEVLLVLKNLNHAFLSYGGFPLVTKRVTPYYGAT